MMMQVDHVITKPDVVSLVNLSVTVTVGFIVVRIELVLSG